MVGYSIKRFEMSKVELWSKSRLSNLAFTERKVE